MRVAASAAGATPPSRKWWRGGLASPELSGPGEDRIEHLFGESAGEGVLLAHVETAQQGFAIVEWHLHAVAELGSRPNAEFLAGHLIPETTQHDDHLQVGERLDLPLKEGTTGVTLDRGRLVLRWGSLDRRRGPGTVHLAPIIDAHRVGLVRIPGAVQRPVEPVA